MTLKRDAGYMELIDPGSDRHLLRIGTVQCVHCYAHFPEPRLGNSEEDKLTRVGPGYQRGFCMRCGGFICGPCCAACVPAEQYIENIEKGRPEDYRPIVSSPFDLSGPNAGDIWGGK